MREPWKDDEAFVAVAEAMWMTDLRLAKSHQTKGKADAERRMVLRYEGFNALPRMLETAERISAALAGMDASEYRRIVHEAVATKMLEGV